METATPRPEFHHTAAKERILAPDVARGLMLWSIAVANGVGSWYIYGSGQAEPSHEGIVNSIVVIFNAMFVEVRGLPMFALLFGYGIGMLVVREARRNVEWKSARRLLWRRYGWLAAFGAFHALFLYFGDILLTYALFGLIVVFLIPLSDRTLLWTAGALATVAFFMALTTNDVETFGAAAGGAEALNNDYVHKQLLIGGVSVVSAPAVVLDNLPRLGALIILGIVAARRNVLGAAGEHRRLLIWVAVVGMTAAVATGLASGLATLDVIGTGLWPQLSAAAGIVAGPGIIAAIALVCMRPQRAIRAAALEGRQATPPEPFRSLQALGQRSMSGYVAQSVLFQIIAASWFLDLFADVSVSVVALWSTAVWLVTLIAARALAAAGKPGPLEALHRRLTYGAGENRRK